MADQTLLLVPTELERKLLEAAGTWPVNVRPELCGFGPIAAAARCASLLAQHAPANVLLVGIAGTYDPSGLPLKSAHCFESVRLDGVGAGEGDDRLGPADLGLPQWPGPEPTPVVDSLPLVPGAGSHAGELLTVCSCAGTASQASDRQQRFPAAQAEDMEAFAVALACHLGGVPLGVVRGISNVAGDRDVTSWQIAGALAAARQEALAWIAARP